MSGAAVWAGDRIIGVITEHHRREGLGRLTATRLDQCLGSSEEGCRRTADALGDAGWADTMPVSVTWLARSGYLQQVRDIAPAGALLDREAEIDELVEFCAEDEPYLYLQAGPWAGKSALMSYFVLNPPPGVAVLSFFVTARLAAQADSDAFAEALLDQLCAFTGYERPLELSNSARESLRVGLLASAVERCRELGCRLLLVVDGMDEDRGARPGSGISSIAALLPKAVEGNLRIVLTGRPHPPIPEDVAQDHPLRGCRVRELPVSAHARATERVARLELDEILAGDRALHNDLIGFITASGGGLTRDDLAHLTGSAPFELDAMLNGFLVRTVAARTDHETGEPTRVFLFTHETLHKEAVDRLGATLLNKYREQLSRWADTYRDLGWPPGTPGYLLRVTRACSRSCLLPER
jgi:hypothetical protein